MSFFETLGLSEHPTPAGLHAAIAARNSPEADQMDAEALHARQVAPHNQPMRDPETVIGQQIRKTLARRSDVRAPGPAPVIRCRNDGGETSERERHSNNPLPQAQTVAWCITCNESSACLVPFWVAVGRFIVQVDLCPVCTVSAIDSGAVPQIGDWW